MCISREQRVEEGHVAMQPTQRQRRAIAMACKYADFVM